MLCLSHLIIFPSHWILIFDPLKTTAGSRILRSMKQFAPLVMIIALSGVPASAQEQDSEGLSLMERGAQMFMEGILQQMEPTLKDLEGLGEEVGPALRGFAEQMGPALSDLLAQVEDWSAYHPPEILPNGDIILRKKTPEEIGPDATPELGPELGPDGSIDL